MLMKNKKNLLIILGVVGFCIFCCIIAPLLPDENNMQNENSNELVNENNNEDEVVYTKNEKINEFLNEFNKKNPEYAFNSEMIHNQLSHKVYVYNNVLKSIEILSKTDNGKNMISIQMDKYGDTNELKNMFSAMMKVFVEDIAEEKITDLWSQLIEGNYTIDYSENRNALQYENVYMSFSDSGEVEVYGKPHYCFVRIYGEK